MRRFSAVMTRSSAGRVGTGRLRVIALGADLHRQLAAPLLAVGEVLKGAAEGVAGLPAEVAAGGRVDVDALDRVEHPPAEALVDLAVLGVMALDHRRGAGVQLREVVGRE